MNRWQKESKPSPGTHAWLDEVFTYHAATEEQVKHYQEVREAAKFFAGKIATYVPDCADKTAAMRKLRECVMTANAAIALEGLV